MMFGRVPRPISLSAFIVASVQHKQHGVPALKVFTNNFEVKSSTYYSVTLDASCYVPWMNIESRLRLTYKRSQGQCRV